MSPSRAVGSQRKHGRGLVPCPGKGSPEDAVGLVTASRPVTSRSTGKGGDGAGKQTDQPRGPRGLTQDRRTTGPTSPAAGGWAGPPPQGARKERLSPPPPTSCSDGFGTPPTPGSSCAVSTLTHDPPAVSTPACPPDPRPPINRPPWGAALGPGGHSAPGFLFEPRGN